MSKKIFGVVIVFLLGLSAFALDGWTREGDRWIKLVRQGDSRDGDWSNRLAYKLSLPASYNPRDTRRYATVVHYHGYGGKNQTQTDPSKCGSVFGSLWKRQKDPIIGIFPLWIGRFWGGRQVTRFLIDILDYEKTRLRIDPDRIYITGQSMGGYGTYSTVAHYPNYFAAAVPISGEWGPFGKGGRSGVPNDLAPWHHLPYWAAHGVKDHVVLHKDDLACVNKMQAGGIYIRYTAFPKGGHHVKEKIFSNQAFFDWLLAQKRGTAHNYELAVHDGKDVRVLGYFEPGSTHPISAHGAAGIFAGWTCVSGSAFVHTSTPSFVETARFADARAPETTVTMPAGDVIIRATFTRPNSSR
jgi:hypothetical protein